MKEDNPHYQAILNAIDKSCTCEVIRAIADICHNKAKKVVESNQLGH